MAIPLWGVSRKRCAVFRPRVMVAPNLEAPDGRQPAFSLAVRCHSSAPREAGASNPFALPQLPLSSHAHLPGRLARILGRNGDITIDPTASPRNANV
jgi:hypothetical protein